MYDITCVIIESLYGVDHTVFHHPPSPILVSAIYGTWGKTSRTVVVCVCIIYIIILYNANVNVLLYVYVCVCVYDCWLCVSNTDETFNPRRIASASPLRFETVVKFVFRKNQKDFKGFPVCIILLLFFFYLSRRQWS